MFAVGEWRNWQSATTAQALMQVFANLAYVNERYSVERGDYNQMLLGEAAATPAMIETAKRNTGRTDEVLAASQTFAAALGASDRAAVEGPIAAAAKNMRQLRDTAWPQMQKPRAERDPQVVARYVPEATEVLQAIAKISSALELRASNENTSIGRLASLARISAAMRDTAGRRSTMLTTYLGSGKKFTPETMEQFLLLDGQVAAYWAVLLHAGHELDDVPGISAALEAAEKGFVVEGGRATRKIFDAAKSPDAPAPMPVGEWRAQISPILVKSLAPRDAAFAAAAIQSQTSIANARLGFILACVGIVAILALIAGFAVFITRRVVQPIRTLAVGIEQISKGVFDVDIPGLDRRDEVGEIGRAVEVLRGNSQEMVRLQEDQVTIRVQAEQDRRKAFHDVADELERVVGQIAGSVSSTSEELQASARGMSIMAEQTSSRSGQATQASQVANDMVGAVAAAAEELSASVTEIGARVKESARIAGVAVTEANDAASKVTTMSEAARRIGDILRLISDIAGQTNLLALNATIEAARAGEAGRGFAVVASEVKNLAEQTSKATAEIEAQISTVQRATDEAVSAITGIASTIGHMNEISTTIASAVFQQSAATDEIASSIARASEGARDASENMIEVNQTAAETGSAASQVLGASTELSRTSTELRVATDTFVARIRSA
ncbi:methyl-accepting chemotaxis protein [Azorhizobium sp. AG788]|uniref:methyl-accepting chemotaxis protein n=1 Tax=Azorhizobium sp. AG788 TaxID=2183897 RepID=UPI003139839E